MTFLKYIIVFSIFLISCSDETEVTDVNNQSDKSDVGETNETANSCLSTDELQGHTILLTFADSCCLVDSTCKELITESLYKIKHWTKGEKIIMSCTFSPSQSKMSSVEYFYSDKVFTNFDGVFYYFIFTNQNGDSFIGCFFFSYSDEFLYEVQATATNLIIHDEVGIVLNTTCGFITNHSNLDAGAYTLISLDSVNILTPLE